MHAQRILQVVPDGSGTLLINKAFAGQAWSIVVNFDAETIAGNVFNFDGSDPQFLFCEIVDPSDFANAKSVRLDCKGSDGCPVYPCTPTQWTELGTVSVATSFFVPPGTPLGCNQFDPPECAGVCPNDPDAQCVASGAGCACVNPKAAADRNGS